MTKSSTRLTGVAAIVVALTMPMPVLSAGSPGHLAKARPGAAPCASSKAKRDASSDACAKAGKKPAKGKRAPPRPDCAGLSHKRARGETRSAFERCAKAGSTRAKKLKKADRDDKGGLAKDLKKPDRDDKQGLAKDPKKPDRDDKQGPGEKFDEGADKRANPGDVAAGDAWDDDWIDIGDVPLLLEFDRG